MFLTSDADPPPALDSVEFYRSIPFTTVKGVKAETLVSPDPQRVQRFYTVVNWDDFAAKHFHDPDGCSVDRCRSCSDQRSIVQLFHQGAVIVRVIPLR